MSNLGLFDPELRDKAWFQTGLLAEGWFDYDLIAAAATSGVSGDIAWTQDADTWAVASTATVTGSAAWTQGSDTWGLTGSVAGDAPTPIVEVGGGKPWKQKWRQQLIDALTEVRTPVPKKTKKAILRAERVLETLPDDSQAIEALRVELTKLERYRYIPERYLQELDRTLAEAWLEALERDDEEVILLLH